MVDEPATAVTVPPVHVVEAFGVAATMRPAGRLSVKSRDVAATELGLLLIVNCSVDVPPTLITSGEKTLLNVGGTGVMVMLSVAPASTFNEFSASSLVVLVSNPGAVDAGTAIWTLNMQVSPAPRLPLNKDTVEVPVTDEPVPQTSFNGRFVATRPDANPSRSSVKERRIKPLASLFVMA